MAIVPVPRNLAELQTPAPLVDAGILAANLARMARAWPGERLRPHVKAHKCTELARHQAQHGHPGFTCATIREVEGHGGGRARGGPAAGQRGRSTRAGSGPGRCGARVTVAVDSPATIARRRSAAGCTRS